MNYTYLDSPVGTLLLAGDKDGLKRIVFPGPEGAEKPEPGWSEDAAPLTEAISQLKDYFAGERTAFDLALEPEGTPFQLAVWKELGNIPYGETISYGQLADRLEKPKAVRAVGAANGANPLPIVVPCHRVIGANGKLVGFGGGLPVKKALLDLEQGGTLF